MTARGFAFGDADVVDDFVDAVVDGGGDGGVVGGDETGAEAGTDSGVHALLATSTPPYRRVNDKGDVR